MGGLSPFSERASAIAESREIINPLEIRQVGEKGPAIDGIEVAEFESHDALKEWLKRKAPAFLREQG